MYQNIILKRRASMNEQKVLRFLDEHADTGFSVKALHSALSKKISISEVTISRILKKLESKHQVHKQPNCESGSIYRRTFDANKDNLVWTDNRYVMPIIDERINALIHLIAKEKGGVALSHELTIYLKSSIKNENE